MTQPSDSSIHKGKNANDRIKIGLIGCGGIARSHLDDLLSIYESDNIEVIAVCDVYQTRAARFLERISRANGHAAVCSDYRQVLDMRDVDKVVILTPEHSHAYLCLDAMDASKHVYVEKPMTLDISDCIKVVEKAEETGLKLQVGVQGMSDDSYEAAHEAIKSGVLGKVVHAQTDYVRRYDKLGPWRFGDIAEIIKPEDMDWKGWLHPAPAVTWDPHRFFEWQCFSEYSGGIATALFIHRITRIIKACGLTFPERVTGMGGIYTWIDGRDLPDSIEMIAEYGPVENVTNGMTIHILGTMANDQGNRHCIRGTHATLNFLENGWEIKDADSGEIIQSHERTGAEDITLHHMNHHKAIREGAALNCPPELGLYGVVPCVMANESWRQKRLVTWNPSRQRVE